MTIQVVSNDVPAEQPAKAPEQPAPEAKAPEQNESTESETEETEETDESSEAEAEETSEKEDEVPKEKHKKKSGFQRRIDKLNARNAEAQRELEYWKAQAMKDKAEAPKSEKVESKPVDGKPNPDSFETHAEYVEALTDWKTDQKLKEHTEKQEKSKLQGEQEKILKTHTERVLAFAKKTEDFNDVIAEVDHIPVSATVQQIVITSENGPELMYELAKNPEEYERICKLPPLAAARELGKIDARISAASEEKKPEIKKTTKAPKPIEPVGTGRGTVAKSIDDPSLSQAEYERLRRKQMERQQAG